jgi:hypothetical protein
MTASTSSLRFTPQSRFRHQYQIVPSKDDNMGVTHSPDVSVVNERDEALDGAQSRDRLSWRKQAVIDLKPSWHRDT